MGSVRQYIAEVSPLRLPPPALCGLSDVQSLRSGFRPCSRLEGRPQKVENRLEQIGIRPRASMPVRYTQAKGVSARPTAGVAFHLATPRSSAQCVNGRAYEIVSVHRQSRPVPNVAPVEHINMFIERRFDGRSTGAVSAANSKFCNGDEVRRGRSQIQCSPRAGWRNGSEGPLEAHWGQRPSHVVDVDQCIG
jgi:hypothetical protein